MTYIITETAGTSFSPEDPDPANLADGNCAGATAGNAENINLFF